MAGKLSKGRNATISDLKALDILRGQIDPKRPESQFDWKLLGEAKLPEKPPVDSITIQDYAQRTGLSNTRAFVHLTEFVARGVLETGLFPTGWRKSKVRYYWAKKRG